MLAQSALTLGHLAGGRFILGLGGGEARTPSRTASTTRARDSVRGGHQLIRRLWDSDGPIDWDGILPAASRPAGHRAVPAGCRGSGSGPTARGCSHRRRYPMAGGRPARIDSLRSTTPRCSSVVRTSAERAGRDPMAITPCSIQVCLIGETDAALAEILEAPLVKACSAPGIRRDAAQLRF